MTGITPYKLDEALTFVLQTAQDNKGFVLEQAPLVAQEIVAWSFWHAVVWAAIYLVAMVTLITVWWHRRCVVKDAFGRDAYVRSDGFAVPPMVFLVVLAILFWIGLAMNTSNALKAATAPRLVVLDYIKESVK